MQPRRAVAASLLVLVVACALLPPSEAFWSWKKKDTDVEIEHTEKGADVEHTVDSLDFDNNIHTLEEDSNAQIGEEIDNLHTISEEQVNSDLPDSYWFNEVTGQSQWDEPHYEFIDGA
ncbi:hypothetical protein H632_c2550p1 [Helicosporidium sp. ATCC 50920]|nr:hypothetical protein H632_c2550p1 [Helicosporidium sp. ATCC 50920]|eukprot:KDD73089.1 hypothetical protein H632_c2550p1 [Helicosporidium sp. ATCC 50920]